MILEVRLSNIKSYSNQTLRFTDGVNAIIGENGAGKTTILEAIGFAVFDSLPYKIGDFLRRGEKRGEVCVRLLSPKDDRVYEIVRKFSESGTNEYYVHDPEGIKVAEGILEVTDWVKENFDVEINTKTMFENAIGVSQGKIVSQFLETASVRDKIFSPILGIEGYKKAFEKSREYEKYLEEKISKIDKDLAVKRKDIERKNKVEERIRELEIKKTKLKNMLDEMTKKINPIKSRIEEFEKVSSKINDLKIKAKEV
ncbi:MAG TPA: SMC family ATPase, partial [Archaeoglobus veneficus]|nr:SMC family ATPase [Archaeoglobus veneficus]